MYRESYRNNYNTGGVRAIRPRAKTEPTRTTRVYLPVIIKSLTSGVILRGNPFETRTVRETGDTV